MQLQFFYFFYFLGHCHYLGNDTIPIAHQINSLFYEGKFTVTESSYSKSDTIANYSTYSGTLFRKGKYAYSQSNMGLGILEDTVCFYLDTINSIISIGPKRRLEAILLIGFYDPIEIIRYAHLNSSAFQKYREGKSIIYDYIFKKNGDPVIGITVDFLDDSRENSGISIKIVFQQLNRILKDVIEYHFPSGLRNFQTRHITDFLDLNGEKYIAKGPFKNYSVFNSFLFR